MPLFLGIDPGIATTGYGLVEKKGSQLKMVSYGVILTKPTSSLPVRLHQLSLELKLIFDTFNPDEVAVEELFFNSNAKTAMIVGQARGVVLLTCEQNGCGVTGYTPLQVKTAVCGYGRADKKQVQYMVKRLLGITEVPKPDDAADALAIAICHCHSYSLKSKL